MVDQLCIGSILHQFVDDSDLLCFTETCGGANRDQWGISVMITSVNVGTMLKKLSDGRKSHIVVGTVRRASFDKQRITIRHRPICISTVLKEFSKDSKRRFACVL